MSLSRYSRPKALWYWMLPLVCAPKHLVCALHEGPRQQPGAGVVVVVMATPPCSRRQRRHEAAQIRNSVFILEQKNGSEIATVSIQRRSVQTQLTMKRRMFNQCGAIQDTFQDISMHKKHASSH